MMTVFILSLVLLAPYGVLCDTNINNRLAKLEVVLESVLVKNAELESRIERLEVENGRLKASAANIEEAQDPQELRENEIVRDDVNDVIKDQLPLKTAETITKRSNNKRLRFVLSEDTTLGFTAVISNRTLSNLGQGQTIIYDKVITNIGGGYHSHTGIFIAPVSGVYVFNFHTMFEPGDNQYLAIVKDGQTVLHTLGNGVGGTHYITTSRTVVLQVNQGGEVWIRTGDFQGHGPGRVHGFSHTSFSGWILY